MYIILMAKRGLLFAFVILAALVLAAVSVFAHAADFNETKRLISSNVACGELSDEQLEEIGEYYMEQMHPGESHDFMHQRMGLVEGSAAEEKFHISLAKTMYCGELSAGMMGMGAGGMMGSAGSGMMGAYYGAGSLAGILWLIILILLAVALSLLIIWLYRQIKKR